MDSIQKLTTKELEEQVRQFDQENIDFMNEATSQSIQESIQKSMVSYAQLSCAYCLRSLWETIKGFALACKKNKILWTMVFTNS